MKRRLLDGTRVYLSGPMDFVASRANEAKFGWRKRVGEFLARLGVTVFDPCEQAAGAGALLAYSDRRQAAGALDLGRAAWPSAA
jgi:hypothetical protein